MFLIWPPGSFEFSSLCGIFFAFSFLLIVGYLFYVFIKVLPFDSPSLKPTFHFPIPYPHRRIRTRRISPHHYMIVLLQMTRIDLLRSL